MIKSSQRLLIFLNMHPWVDAFVGWSPGVFTEPQLWLQRKIWLKRDLVINFLVLICSSFVLLSYCKTAGPLLHKDMFAKEDHRCPLMDTISTRAGWIPILGPLKQWVGCPSSFGSANWLADLVLLLQTDHVPFQRSLANACKPLDLN